MTTRRSIATQFLSSLGNLFATRLARRVFITGALKARPPRPVDTGIAGASSASLGPKGRASLDLQDGVLKVYHAGSQQNSALRQTAYS
jgi:hypothetical protein